MQKDLYVYYTGTFDDSETDADGNTIIKYEYNVTDTDETVTEAFDPDNVDEANKKFDFDGKEYTIISSALESSTTSVFKSSFDTLDKYAEFIEKVQDANTSIKIGSYEYNTIKHISVGAWGIELNAPIAAGDVLVNDKLDAKFTISFDSIETYVIDAYNDNGTPTDSTDDITGFRLFVNSNITANALSLHNMFTTSQLNGAENYQIVGIASSVTDTVAVDWVNGATSATIENDEVGTIKLDETKELTIVEIKFAGNSGNKLYSFTSTYYALSGADTFVNMNLGRLALGTDYYKVNFNSTKNTQTFDLTGALVEYKMDSDRLTCNELTLDSASDTVEKTEAEADAKITASISGISISSDDLIAYKNENPTLRNYMEGQDEKNITYTVTYDTDKTIKIKVVFGLPNTAILKATYTPAYGDDDAYVTGNLWDDATSDIYKTNFKVIVNGDIKSLSEAVTAGEVIKIEEFDSYYVNLVKIDEDGNYTGEIEWNMTEIENYFATYSTPLTVKLRITTKAEGVSTTQTVSIIITNS